MDDAWAAGLDVLAGMALAVKDSQISAWRAAGHHRCCHL
jgi:hypothetical protein